MKKVPQSHWALFLVANQFLKSVSCWRAARDNHLGWFLTLMFTNTLGVLDIMYLKQRRRGLLRRLYP